MKRYKCSQLPPSVEGHYVYLASDVDHELSQMASAVECKGNEIVGLKERIAELEKQRDEFRYGLAEFCRACDEAPPLQFMEWLDAANKLGADILETAKSEKALKK